MVSTNAPPPHTRVQVCTHTCTTLACMRMRRYTRKSIHSYLVLCIEFLLNSGDARQSQRDTTKGFIGLHIDSCLVLFSS
eukprot:c38840_g1_i1 orf=2-235(-)